LAQFEFAAHGSARWLQKAKRIWQTFANSPAWKAARWSLGLLILAQLIGLNVAAWQLNAQAQLQRDLQNNILTQSFPNVTVVDAPLQMAKELERLQRNSGALSPRDLEWVLQAVGTALPAGQLVSNLDFQVQGNGETRLQGLQLSDSQAKDFAQALRKQGLDAQSNDGKWRIVSLKAGL
jgi:general secretion pathway protein L